MPNASSRKRFFNVAELGLHAGNATTGAWTTDLTANEYTLKKAAAATTSVVNIPVPKAPRGEWQEDGVVKVIKVPYIVTTAALSSAPTAILNKLTFDTTNGDLERAAVTQTLAFSGLDTVGTAAGDHSADVTITTPTALADNETYVLSLTMNEAATSVLNICGMQVEYN